MTVSPSGSQLHIPLIEYPITIMLIFLEAVLYENLEFHTQPRCSCCCLVSRLVRLLASPWTAASQASVSLTVSWSLLKFMSIELVMPCNHLILCHPLLLLPSIFPSIRVFSNESALHIRWPKYWGFSFSICLSKEYSGLISFRIDWLHLLVVQRILRSLL